MKTKQFASSARVSPRAKSAGRIIPDKQIDFSDIPESLTCELKNARRVGRPNSGRTKQLIAIRIDTDLLSSLRKMASLKHKPYQTLMHEMLEGAVKKNAA